MTAKYLDDKLKMKSGWMSVRESAVFLLKIFALLLVLIQLSATGIGAFTSIDNGAAWYYVIYSILNSLAQTAWYGGAIFALSWIVSLIGRLGEVNAGSSWWDNREKSISLLKKSAVMIVLIHVPIIGIGVFMSVDDSSPWYSIVSAILLPITWAAWYGGTVLALAWIVSLIGRQDEVNAGRGWLGNRESAVSFLKIFAVLIVLLQLPLAAIAGYIQIDWDMTWDFIVDSILYTLLMGIFQGCVLFALAWVVSLISERNIKEA